MLLCSNDMPVIYVLNSPDEMNMYSAKVPFIVDCIIDLFKVMCTFIHNKNYIIKFKL